MALLAFWKSSRDQVLGLSIQQIVTSAGDGKLRDNSECAAELRQFLREVPSSYLFRYAETCLVDSFVDSGLVLQDVVNEIGRRLDFEVEDGLYRGTKKSIGFDGIWRTDAIPEIIIETKTTDYITISLDKIARYKKELITQGKVSDEASVLIVVGREDTGALEAQVRGSRFAWDMRLIGVESLINLLRIKELSGEDSTVRRIKDLLRPFEYTKIDRIVDVLFAAAEDVEQQVAEEPSDAPPARGGKLKQVQTARKRIEAKRELALQSLARKLSVPFVQHRRTLFWSADRHARVCVVVSKKYDRGTQRYWYAFHSAWRDFLAEGATSYFLLVCMDRSDFFALPYELVRDNLENLNTTVPPNGKMYWHIALTEEGSGGISWNLSKGRKKIPLTPYRVSL